MKRIYLTIISTLMLGCAACSDFLDTKPGDKYDDGTVWSNQTLVESFVLNIYTGIPYPYQWYMNASLVDEAIPVQNDGIVTRVITSSMTPDDKGVFADNWAYGMHNWWWENVYVNIRACNLFFDNVDNVPFKNNEYKEQITGEVYFLRGYFYYLLLAQYGGVPLIDFVFNTGDDYNIPRNTLKETVDFIVRDLDEAARLLRQNPHTDKTRATEGAALALKSRVLLYAASDLFNSKASWASGYKHPELVSYIDDNRQQRWEAAKKAAEEVLKLNYSLYESDNDPVTNFENVFLKMTSDEQIFITIYDKINYPAHYGTDWIAAICGTPTSGGYALNQITANLADAFENSDGSYFNFSAKADAPYADRDPRFYATILYDGADWAKPDWDTYNGVLPYTVHNGRWTDETGATTAVAPDYKAGAVNTGYLIRKFIDPSVFQYYYGPRQPQPYIQIRFAEIILNYAETCIELGDEAGARTAINRIRKRAGMPDINDAGAELLKRYRNERMVELAWEQHRFFDVRRWMIAPEAYGQAKGVNIIYPVDGSTDNPVYNEINVEPRVWNNSHYLIPISRGELQKNQALLQNPDYN